MKKFCLRTFVIFAVLFGCCQLKPTHSISDAFPTGTERSYSLVQDVFINDNKGGRNIGYRLTGTVTVGSVWGSDELKLLKFNLISPQIYVRPKESSSASDFVVHKSILDKIANKEFYAVWHLGKITKAYINKKEDSSVVNLKKSVISIFQYQLLDGEYSEDDVSGTCDVTYISKSPSLYEKIKTKCRSDDVKYHSRTDKAIGVSVVSTRRAKFQVTPDGTLDKFESTEFYNVSIVANRNAGSSVQTVFILKFDGSISNVPVLSVKSSNEAIKTLKDVKGQTLMTSVSNKCQNGNCKTFKQMIKDLKGALVSDKIGTFDSALALVKLIPTARSATKEEFIKIFNAHTMQEFKGQLLDMLAATQTTDSHNAAKELLEFTSEKHMDNVERYLQALAIGSQPHESVIISLLDEVKKTFENQKVKDTMVQTIASMTYRYARLPGNGYKSNIVENVRLFISKSLSECKDTSCKEIYIRALHNLQSPDTIENLLELVYDNERIISVAAMKALRNFPKNSWSHENKKQFEDIFYQKTKKFDSSVRTLSLDILLEQDLPLNEIKHLFEYLRSNDKSFEVKQYLLQNINLISSQCSGFKEKVKQILHTDPTLNNYHIIGQKGLTTALSGKFSKNPSFNGTILSIQEIHSGVLKRGIVDMTVNINKDKFSVFKLGIYASGLSSFIGGSDKEDQDSDTATAGMEISVQGSYFRPLVFFQGQGELMGHVWSGTASEPTPAYTATTILHDHQEVIRLQNGASLSINVLGAVSIALTGQVEFSLWNRNAHCQVDKNAGIALLGTVNMDTNFITLENSFTVTQEPKLNLISDIDFSSDVKLCMQLTQPATRLRHDIMKMEKIPSTKHNISIIRKIEYKLPGYTHALNQKNNEMCNMIFAIEGEIHN